MEWIIESYDRRTDRDGENHFTTEDAFIRASEDLLRNAWRVVHRPKSILSDSRDSLAALVGSGYKPPSGDPQTAVHGHL